MQRHHGPGHGYRRSLHRPGEIRPRLEEATGVGGARASLRENRPPQAEHRTNLFYTLQSA
jgi:hypothetical protein